MAEASYATLRDSVDNHFQHNDILSCFLVLVIPIAEWELGLKIDDISPVREIQKLEVPVYLIGGSADVVAPASGIQRLYTAASCEKNLWLVKGVGHGDFFFCAPLEYQKRIGEFLRKYLPE